MPEGKNRRIRTAILHVLWASLTFCCFILAVFYGFSGDGKNIGILNLEQGIPSGEAVQLQRQRVRQEKQALPFTVWSEQRGVTVENPEFRRKSNADLIRVCGDSRLVLDGDAWLDWVDTNGCLMDEEICIELFGSTRVLGQKIKIQDKEYEIKGLLQKTGKTVLIETKETEQVNFNKISVEMDGDGPQEEQLRKWSEQFGITGVSTNYQTYKKAGQLAVGLLPCILCMYILAPLIKKVHKTKYRPMEKMLYLLGMVLVLCIFFWIAGINLKIPDDWMPSRWSDFEFFSELWRKKSQSMEVLMKGEKSRPESIYVAGMLNAVKYSLLSLCFLFLWLKKLKIKKCTEAFSWSILFCVLTFFMTVFYGYNSITPAGNRLLWLLFPVFVWAGWGVSWLQPSLHWQELSSSTDQSCQ